MDAAGATFRARDRGLALLAKLYKVPPKFFININTTDTVAGVYNAAGWPVLADIGGIEVTATSPAVIDATNISRVNWHCSFAYDHERKRTGNIEKARVYLGDRGDYAGARSFSANWGGEGMCLLWTDQHAEFSKSKTMIDQKDPNIYHHNEFNGEGGTEVFGGVQVLPDTLDTHLRFFSEDEDNALLPGE